jgi:hypothetical protein
MLKEYVMQDNSMNQGFVYCLHHFGLFLDAEERSDMCLFETSVGRQTDYKALRHKR